MRDERDITRDHAMRYARLFGCDPALILFPSNLTHYVPPVEGESDRISLSFNVFPYGILGSEENLTHLRLPNDK